LTLSAQASAAPRAEPLTVTRLPDAEMELLVATASDKGSGGDTADFSRAISQALRAQQESMKAACAAAPRASSSMAVRWAWEARCRYKRY
jgi:hypothetical protein